MALVSIVMVCYNAERYLSKALDGVGKQTFRDFELVFVNNGSTDNTKDIAESFFKDHPEIAVRQGEIKINNGLPDGRNMGLSLASGEYVMFHDADDWMDPDCLEALARVVQSHHPERIMQEIRFINDNGDVIDKLLYQEDTSRWTKNSLQGDLFLREVITREHLSFAREAYYDDFFFTNLFNSVADNVFFLREIHYNMLMHEYSMTHMYSSKKGYFTVRLAGTFEAMRGIADKLTDAREKMLYEYNCIQRYYSDVFRGVGLSLPDKIHEYKVFNSIVRRYYPDYLDNKNVKLKAPNSFSGHFKRNIWICVRAERIDRFLHIPVVMSMILMIYHVALKLGLYKYAG